MFDLEGFAQPNSVAGSSEPAPQLDVFYGRFVIVFDKATHC